MTHIYYVTGMTCNACKASVEKALSTVDGVDKVEVDLQQSEAHLSMSKSIEIDELQNVLSEKYHISLMNSTKNQGDNSGSAQQQGKLKQLFPLFLIFGYILVASILINWDPWHIETFMLDFMGLFYVVFSFFKLLDLKGFPQSFRMYDPLAKSVPVYAWLYPFIEVALGLMFLMRFQITLALILTLVVLGITTIGVTRTLLSKKSIQCACLGTALKLPMTKATFIENSVMIVMAVIMLIKTYN